MRYGVPAASDRLSMADLELEKRSFASRTSHEE